MVDRALTGLAHNRRTALCLVLAGIIAIAVGLVVVWVL